MFVDAENLPSVTLNSESSAFPQVKCLVSCYKFCIPFQLVFAIKGCEFKSVKIEYPIWLMLHCLLHKCFYEVLFIFKQLSVDSW